MTIGRLLCVALVVLLLFGVISVSNAGVLSYDIAYWCWSDSAHTNLTTIFNTKPDDLNSIVLIVHQVVYDAQSSRTKLLQNGENLDSFGAAPLYLYSYSVFNISWLEDTGSGLTQLITDWNAPCALVTRVNSRMMQDWSASKIGNSLRWTWNADNIGLRTGSGISGFWAVATSCESMPTNANVYSGDGVVIDEGISVMGPVPEPASLIALLVGIIGLSQRKLYRRR